MRHPAFQLLLPPLAECSKIGGFSWRKQGKVLAAYSFALFLRGDRILEVKPLYIITLSWWKPYWYWLHITNAGGLGMYWRCLFENPVAFFPLFKGT
jgi:hypothetical protein